MLSCKYHTAPNFGGRKIWWIWRFTTNLAKYYPPTSFNLVYVLSKVVNPPMLSTAKVLYCMVVGYLLIHRVMFLITFQLIKVEDLLHHAQQQVNCYRNIATNISASVCVLCVLYVCVCVCVCVCLCVCVCPSLRLLITSGMMWTQYDWLNKFYSFYTHIAHIAPAYYPAIHCIPGISWGR